MTSVGQLEEEAAATRARLHATIDRIQDRLTVSGMVDEVMGQVGVTKLQTGPDALFGLLRRNPLPVMVAAAGLGFLLYQLNKRDRALRGAALPEDLVTVRAMNDGQARVYDPDHPARHPTQDVERRRIEA